MKREDLQKAYPAIPQECHDALWLAAGSIQEKMGGRRRWSFILAAILCLLLVLAGAALAFTKLGILNFGRLKAASNNYSQQDVESLVSVDLAEKTLNGVTVKVKEAYFDGRVLEVLYSVSSSQQGSNTGMYQEADEGAADALLSAAGIDLQTTHGYININGQQVSLRTMDFQPGDTPGEYQFLVDSDLQYEDGATGETRMLRPKETMEISINTTGNKTDALTYTLPVPEEDKWSLPLPPSTQVNGCTVTFTDLHFSPINTYIEYAVQMPASMVPEGVLEDTEEAGLALFDLQGRFCPMGLVDEKGEQLPGVGKAGGSRECRRLDNGDLWTVYYVEYTANGEYPDTIYLSVDGAMVPIPVTASKK